jgi:hypothetical protein
MEITIPNRLFFVQVKSRVRTSIQTIDLKYRVHLVFRITPKFILQAISSNEIQFNQTPISPSVFCEKSIIPKLTSNFNQVS